VNKQGPDGIGWCDYTWSPIVGCSPVSEGCSACYAEAISRRFGLPWGKAVFKPERLDEPMRAKKPSRIFVCSMSDLFHESVEPLWINRVFGAIFKASMERGHTFIILTKRPERMAAHFAATHYWCDSVSDAIPHAWPNIWLGVTAENQARADERIPILLRIPAAVRFVSVEPMLEEMNIATYMLNDYDKAGFDHQLLTTDNMQREKLDWVIAGPETGAAKRPCKAEWIESLAIDCDQFGVAFYDKRTAWIRREWPEQEADKPTARKGAASEQERAME
jgi:protein gp37